MNGAEKDKNIIPVDALVKVIAQTKTKSITGYLKYFPLVFLWMVISTSRPEIKNIEDMRKDSE